MKLTRRFVLKATAVTTTLASGLIPRASKADANPDDYLEMYSWPLSAFPNETIEFFIGNEGYAYQHAAGTNAPVPVTVMLTAEVTRMGDSSFSHTLTGSISAVLKPCTPTNPWAVGCDWSAAFTFTVPTGWPSGIYVMTVSNATQTASVPFVVKGHATGNHRALVILPSASDLAYNHWGPGSARIGRNLYNGPPPERIPYSPHVHALRPRLWDHNLPRYYQWAAWFTAMASTIGPVEYATNLDLHSDPAHLDKYRLVLTIGHDEYWSKEMRDNLEGFIANGGNVCFFSGNLCWWQVRFEPDTGLKEMISYKGAQLGPDPIIDCDTSRNTRTWDHLFHSATDTGPNRPEAVMTGVTFRTGAQIDFERKNVPALFAYNVNWPSYWLYRNTCVGSQFGLFNTANGMVSVVGYEVDATSEHTPHNFVLLAWTDNLLSFNTVTQDYDTWWINADTDRQTPARDAEGPQTCGHAHLGIYRRYGAVFTSASVDWQNGISDPNNPVAKITTNLFQRFLKPNAGAIPVQNPGFERWFDSAQAGGAPDGWILEGAGSVSRSNTTATNTSNSTLRVNASAGFTWISHYPLTCATGRYYRVGCWVKWTPPWFGNVSGPSVKLQSNNVLPGNLGGIDFVSASFDSVAAQHSADGSQWRFVSAVGKADPAEGASFIARVKLEVYGGIAEFDGVVVEDLGLIDGDWDRGLPVTNSRFATWNGTSFDAWYKEGAGAISQGTSPVGASLVVNAAAGQTWVSQPVDLVERRTFYRVGCWAKASGPGATLRLQSTNILPGNVGGVDFVTAEHSGSGQWEYIYCVARASDAEGVMFWPRVKLQVASGLVAEFSDVSIDIVGGSDDQGRLT
ncbi:hypothetical protein JY651_12180 [Pyxidicoccus parkwayensis]|uniref:N,N-dimethylformamidase beta subunit-like C-terminal domain-containing protein n=1 Tax=Pyxidicoccus parkwayensis TaxID=2813578 RepID=A0ABX7P588_9BACT|nr:N,N-dimethylformamidase beta subunit family domain-containing protein [Pyxidicoccus parkwaysis]QSQ25634.1 hypothetical protein JY651_12180 [Pyxidicoccus parkwaysis]